MIERHELAVVMKSVGAVVKQYVAAAVDGLAKKLDDFDARLRAIPAGPPGRSAYQLAVERGYGGTELQWLDSQRGEPGKSVDPQLIREEVTRAVAALPAPRDGHDADPEVIRDLVAEAIARLPAPQNGKDADPAVIAQAVADAVAAIPKPSDGKSVTPADVAPLIALAVSEAVAALPTPRNGRDADPAQIAVAVAEAVAALPQPADGKSVTTEDVAPMIAAAVAEAVAAIPPPRDGADADPEVIRAMVADAVAALPQPRAGKDADMTLVERMIAEHVSAAVARIPVPNNGRDADPEMVRMVAADVLPGLVDKAQAVLAERMDAAIVALPKPKDGLNGDPVHPDTLARMVLDAVRVEIAQMPRPRDGDDGHDAADLNVLPSIDEARRYARGTWASHRGGLIHAARATDPVTAGITAAGWVVITEGLAAAPMVTQSDDFREITVSCELTSGAASVTKFKMPALIDRGVWRDGDYEAGDSVTWHGSIWIAQCATNAKPDSGADWRLSVKRGRDGKDATPGAPGAQTREPVRLK